MVNGEWYFNIMSYFAEKNFFGKGMFGGPSLGPEGGGPSSNPIVVVDTFLSSGTWTAPDSQTVTVECWGAGGGGSTGVGAGGGGAYARSTVAVIAQGYAVAVGTSAANVNGGDSSFNSTSVVAKGGLSGTNGGTGGTAAASTGSTKFSGGNGEVAVGNAAGGSGAGSAEAGANGSGGGAFGGDHEGGWCTNNFAGPLSGGGYVISGVSNAGHRGEVRITYNSTIAAGFPQVLGRSAKRIPSGTSHAATMPTNIAAGEQLIMIVSCGGNQTITASGWTKVAQVTDGTNSVSLALFYKEAVGSDTATIQFSSAQRGTYQIMRIKDGGVPTWTTATGNSTNPNPPLHTPAAGSAKYLWLAVASWNSAPSPITAYPTDYGSGILVSSEIFSGSSQVVTERYLEAASQDPGVFTSGTEQWIASTISIPFAS